MENNFKDNICVYRQVNHLAVHLKHCKLTIYLNKKLKKKIYIYIYKEKIK